MCGSGMLNSDHLIRHHMGRWPIKNVPLYEKASTMTGDRIQIFLSQESGYVWLVAADNGQSYRNFWLTVRLLELESELPKVSLIPVGSSMRRS